MAVLGITSIYSNPIPDAFGECLGELTVVWDGENICDPNVRLIEITEDMPEAQAVTGIYETFLAQTAK